MIDYKRICETLVHPLILQIMRALEDADEPLSPSLMATDLDVPLGRLSYHVRLLAEKGLIRETHVLPRRGALEHFYVIDS